MLKFGNTFVNYGGTYLTGVKYNPNPLNLPDYTIRVKYRSGVTPSWVYSKTLVDANENIWDLTKTYDRTYWAYALDDENDLLEVIGGNTSGIKNMNGMFAGSTALSSVNLTDLSQAMLMYMTFSNCKSLEKVTLRNTKNVSNMEGLFGACSSLKDAPELVTNNVTNMKTMFQGCVSLTSVPLYNTNKVTTMESMFDTCVNLSSTPCYDTTNVTSMKNMMNTCQSLTSVPLFNTNKVQNMNNAFSFCYKVQTGALDLYNQASTQTTPPSSHNGTFQYCGSMTTQGAAELAQIPSDWK